MYIKINNAQLFLDTGSVSKRNSGVSVLLLYMIKIKENQRKSTGKWVYLEISKQIVVDF